VKWLAKTGGRPRQGKLHGKQGTKKSDEERVIGEDLREKRQKGETNRK
jgi:hypothetical protein